MKLFSTLFALILSCSLFGQYLEDFPIDNRGILNPGCTGVTLGSCSNTDFTGVDWTLGGDLSGIDTEGFFTTGGALFTADSDTRACWISPTIYIDAVGSSSLTVSLSIPGTSTGWDDISGSDFMDVEYSVDGGGFTIIPNVHGCANSHTVSGQGCGGLAAGTNYIATASGIVGNTLNIQVCIDANLSSEQGQINSVSVPEMGTSLPIELISFTAETEEAGIQLDWATAIERNNDYFQLERSTDGFNFEPIAKMAGAENSFQTLEYQHLDTNYPNATQLYYRLMQVDFNGKITYSPVVVVENSASAQSVRIFPNPIDNFSNMQVESALSGNLQISIVDIQGKAILVNTVDSDSGNWQLDTSTLPAGSYILNIKSANNTVSKRFVKMAN